VARQLCLLWGAHSVRSDNVGSFDEINRLAESHALAEGFAKPGDLIIVVSGVPFGKAGTTNNLRVLQLGVQPSP
jgi:pyruvate kinase